MLHYRSSLDYFFKTVSNKTIYILSVSSGINGMHKKSMLLETTISNQMNLYYARFVIVVQFVDWPKNICINFIIRFLFPLICFFFFSFFASFDDTYLFTFFVVVIIWAILSHISHSIKNMIFATKCHKFCRYIVPAYV